MINLSSLMSLTRHHTILIIYRVNGVAGNSVDSTTFGYTLGYQVNDNMQLTFGYMATIGDGNPGDIQLDGVQVSLIFGWHPLIEGMGRVVIEHNTCSSNQSGSAMRLSLLPRWNLKNSGQCPEPPQHRRFHRRFLPDPMPHRMAHP